ncbi:ABC transporter permease [Svornostia abyssi]|uniref:ABC transporter permease n=1 Tax=Svornostia abyssi TaxID=2898438 RepID=A0ABY5PMM5_9ACTN|nr:ABC transporter permease [Parviterribacteraceae bacterium J379]
MTKLAVHTLMARRMRLLLTVLTITLGVGFTAGTMILSDTTKSAVRTALTDISGGVDVVVRGREVAEGGVRTPVPADTLSDVRATPGVSSAAAYYDGYADVLGRDGKVLDVTQGVGMAWIDDRELSLFRLAAGAAPAAGEVVLDRETAADAGVGVGDRVRVVTAAGLQRARVSGIAELTSDTSFGRTSFTLFEEAEARAALGASGPSAVLVRGPDPAALRARLAAALADRDGVQVVTGAESLAGDQDDADAALGAFSGVLLAFGIIALIVGAMTIANTFAVTTAQRTQELALLRAIGATRGQVLGSVLLEAALLGLVASGLGLLVGLGVAEGLPALLSAAGLELPAGPTQLTGTTVAAALAAGVGVTLVAALVPALRATRVRPVAALREAAVEEEATGRRRLVGGVLVLGCAIAAAINAASSGKAAVAGGAALLALVACAMLGPGALTAVSRALSRPLSRVLPSAGLGTANVARGARRATATGMALAVGVALVSGASLFAATASQSVTGDVQDAFRADGVLRPAGSAAGLPSAVAADADADAVPGVTAVALRSGMTRLSGKDVTVTGTDLASDMVRVDVRDGRLPTGAGAIAVADDLARERGWRVGARLALRTPDGPREVRVAGIFAATGAWSQVLADTAEVARLGTADLLDAVLLDGDAGALRQVDRELADQPTVVRESVAAYASTRAGVLQQILSLVLGLLGVAVIVAVLGIATTIGLSVHERTRELGALRAIGMERTQLRRTVRAEAVLVALAGALAGLAVGLGATVAAVEAVGDFGSPVLPGGVLVATVAGAVLAGVLAAAVPARRAARMPVLEAMRA